MGPKRTPNLVTSHDPQLQFHRIIRSEPKVPKLPPPFYEYSKTPLKRILRDCSNLCSAMSFFYRQHKNVTMKTLLGTEN